MFKFFLFFPFLLWLVACGLESPSERKNSNPVGESLDPSLFQENDSWVGTGRLMMAGVLRSPRESFHVKLSGQFLQQESSLVLHLFFDDFVYDTGLQIRFHRAHQEGGDEEHSSDDLFVEIAEPGYSFRPLGVMSDVIAQDGTFVIRLEAINRLNNDRRVLVWNDQVLLDSEQRRARDKIIEGNADLDSLKNDFVFFSWGQGYHWGLSLFSMRLLKIEREATYVDL